MLPVVLISLMRQSCAKVTRNFRHYPSGTQSHRHQRRVLSLLLLAYGPAYGKVQQGLR